MANIKSAIKRIRQSERRRETNRRNRGRLRTQVKKLRRALETNNVEEAETLLRPTLGLVDRSAQLGAIKKNTASRIKSRLHLRLNALKAPEQKQSA